MFNNKKHKELLELKSLRRRDQRAYLNDIRVELKRLQDKIETYQERELRARNRVDISLDEYNEMKTKIEDLQLEIDRLRSNLYELNIPNDISIIPGTVEICTRYDEASRKRKYRIEFYTEW